MKKALFASTALVAFAGTAVADVDLSGRAEMGIFDSDGLETAQFFTDIDVTFTMSGETDGGLTFGASVDLDEGGDAADATNNDQEDGGATIFISGAFGTVTLGDTDGALDWALTEAGNVGNPGSIADDETAHAGYLGSYLDGAFDGQILRYDYSAGDFGVAVSVELDDADVFDEGFAIGLRYGLDLGGADVSLGIGYQEADVSDAIGVSATATLANGLSFGATYTDFSDTAVDFGALGVDDNPVDSHFSIGVGYTTGAFTVHANYGDFDGDDGAGGVDHDGFGIAATYDLGGGAIVHFGYGSSDVDTVGDFDTVSLGLGLSF